MPVSLTDPLSITIGGSTIALPRTSVGKDESEYTAADGSTEVVASHSYGKRTRRVLRINSSKVSADVYQPDENVRRSMSLYMVFDLPAEGYSAAEALAVYNGFKTMFSANSDAMITKLLGGES
jgi:hypothetical protein